MAVGIDVTSDNIARLAKAVRRLGSDRSIVNNMAKEIKSLALPLRVDVRHNAMTYMPKRGGLNRWVAKVTVAARVRRSANNAGVSIAIGRNGSKRRADINRLDKGRLRAPLFGDRRSWHLQSVKAGFASDGVEKGATEFRQRVVIAVDKAIGDALK